MASKPLDTFLDRYDEIVKMAERMVTDQNHARDLAHEVVLLLSETDPETLRDVLENQKFKSYVSRIVWTSYYGKRGRWRKKNPDFSELPDLSEVPDEPFKTDARAMYREQLDIYYNKLPALEKELFGAHYWKGISIPEIARCAGIGYSTAHRIISETRKRIADEIAKNCTVC